jgi:hypothetical protein
MPLRHHHYAAAARWLKRRRQQMPPFLPMPRLFRRRAAMFERELLPLRRYASAQRVVYAMLILPAMR